MRGPSGRFPVPPVRAGDEFLFKDSTTVVFDTGERIQHPRELAPALRRMTNGSIYYHFLEALRRPPMGKDDFSVWLFEAGKEYEPYLRSLGSIDYHFHSLALLRKELVRALVQAYRLVRKVAPVQLVLAGGGATDDPEGKAVFEEVMEAAEGDHDSHVLLLPSAAHATINALQRLADIILQKSTREGFGLTVTEGLRKGKPVIGGDVGGIRLQVINHHTGFLVNTPEGAAHRIRYLLHHRERMKEMGETGREFVRENFLLTRHLREYLTLMLAIRSGREERILLV